MLHAVSPFKSEPVDCVLWVKQETVEANDYNPNSVAPPEMELLKVSILEDGYTQPIVTFAKEGGREVVDGFHRNRVGKECKEVRDRIKGYLPVVSINKERQEKQDRIAATIRHNRAHGKHKVQAMSDIVIELKNRNWSNDRICRELGMDQDEVLRLCQITGLTELFSDQEFSKSWEVEGQVTESDFVELTDDVAVYGEEVEEFRTVNTSDKDRVFHTYDKWECHKAGFYKSSKAGMTKEECEQEYKVILTDENRFTEALDKVVTEWKNSCEHYLTNKAFNRIAWLGQAAVCIASGVPSECRGGFSLLSTEQQQAADQMALAALNKWLKANGIEEVTLEAAYAYARQSDIY
jgi:ParB-like chromosome segregation protein Spo0J